MGKNWFLHRGIKYNIFGLIPKTSYVTQTLNIKYRGTIEPRAILYKEQVTSTVIILSSSKGCNSILKLNTIKLKYINIKIKDT